MKRVLMIAVIALLAVACNKNQKAVKRLDGTWNATSYTYAYDGITEELITDGYVFKLTFDNCKLKDDEFCSVIMTESYDGDSDSYVLEYRVVAGATYLELRDLDYPAELTNMKIEEFTKTNLTLVTDFGDGEIMTIKLEKEG